MGIEDLNLNLEEHADRVLLITDNSSSKAEITRILEKRSYKWECAGDCPEASKIASQQLFDIIILEHSLNFPPPVELLSALRADPTLKRSPILLLHPDPASLSSASQLAERDVHLLRSPVEPAELLVKLATQLRLRKLKSSEARFDAQVASQNTQLRDLTNRFKHELKEAQSIQRSILPKVLPKDPRCLFASSYLPLEAVGGDLYDLWKIRENVYGFFIGDVSGHGLPAAFIGAMTKMALAYATKDGPDKMLAEMCKGLAELMPEGRFITVAAAFYDAADGKLLIARGGHPSPYIFRKETGEVQELNPRGFPLGVYSTARYELLETTLKPGDKFLMVTDGLTEITDMNNKMVGVSGVGKWFAETAKQSAIESCLTELLLLQEEFRGGRILKDDITMIGLERL